MLLLENTFNLNFKFLESNEKTIWQRHCFEATAPRPIVFYKNVVIPYEDQFQNMYSMPNMSLCICVRVWEQSS